MYDHVLIYVADRNRREALGAVGGECDGLRDDDDDDDYPRDSRGRGAPRRRRRSWLGEMCEFVV